jgi:hypothetical protein
MRIDMAEDALLEPRAHTRVAPSGADSAPWDMVPPTWSANASCVRCPIGAEPDEDEERTEACVRQLASQLIEDAAANALLEHALAGIDPDILNPQDGEASEVARQVMMEALTRCDYFWYVTNTEDGRPSVRGGAVDGSRPRKRGCATRGCRTHIPRHAARRSRR